MANEANIVIVGGGVMAGLVADILLARGETGIVILEAGPPVLMRDPRVWIDVVTTGLVPYQSLYDDPGDYSSSGVDPWKIVAGRVFGRGGSTLHWGGWVPRFMPEDFALFTNTGAGCDWPYQYADLEPFYGAAEIWLQVSGTAVAGQRDWRSAPYPMTSPPLPIAAAPVVAAMDQLGISYQHMPVARNTVAINGQAQCETFNTCEYCPIGGRFTGDQPHDRQAQQVQFIANAPVTSISMSAKKVANGVTYLDASGEAVLLAANAVFLCAGALEIPKLMLASTSSFWPNGLGNDNGLVGRNLVANLYLYCRGTAPQNLHLWQSEVGFPTLCSRQYDTPDDQALGKFFMNMSHGSPMLTPAAMMYQGMSAADIAAAVTGPVAYELQGGMGAFSFPENQVSLAGGTTRFGLPRTQITTPTAIVPQAGVYRTLRRMTALMEAMNFTVADAAAYPQRGDHAASTCRMGTSPETSVVSTELQVWGVDNVYIASNAILPAIGAANLTLTTVAAIMKGLGWSGGAGSRAAAN